MKKLRCVILLAAIQMAGAMPSWAGEARAAGLPKTFSGLDGWHGARLEQGAQVCKLAFPRSFGKAPAELKLLQALAEHYFDMDNDLECMLQVNRAVCDQLKHLAIDEHDLSAAELIIFAREKGRLNIEGEFSDVYDEAYLYPVLIRYKSKLSELIPLQKEAAVANEVCMANFNPSSDAHKQFNALITRLNAENMQSLVRKIDSDCARIQKGMEQD